MKKILMITAIAAVFTGCKEDKEAAVADETVAVQTEVVNDSIDYKAFGMEEDNLPDGLKVGDNAPQIVFTMPDDTRMSLKGLYEKQPVVIIFYRGYWCPVCIKHLSEFAEEAKEIEAKGARLVAITSESYDNVKTTKEETGADFTIISDTDGKVMEAFDVDFKVREDYQGMIQERVDASIAKTNATGEAVLPVPATYIIDTNGKIVYRQFNPNYRERASLQEIIDHLPEKK